MCVQAIIGLVGAAVSAVGAIQQAKAQSAAAEYNAKVSDINAEISDRRAKDALERGADEEQRVRMRTQMMLGQQRAAMAANGVDITFGSPLDTMIDTATLGELDALTTRQNAARENYDYRTQAMNGQAQAALQRGEAKSALSGGYLSAAGTFLGGVGSAFKSASDAGWKFGW